MQAAMATEPTYGEKVAPRISVVSAVKVLGHLQTVLGHIGGAVADGDLAELARLDVLAHVARDGFDVGGRRRGPGIVDHLVGREEGQHVVVLGEHVDRGKDVLQVLFVVRGRRVGAVDGDGRRVDVLQQRA